jgi:pimeloyl-ACP methyl ester carboxylesterase
LWVILVALCIAFTAAARPAGAAHATGKTCQDRTLRVAYDPLLPLLKYTLYGQMCWAGALSADRPVQLLVHGATYNSYYWDFQAYQPETYSYVDHAAARGYVTFNIDRLGAGRSGVPDGLTNNIDSNAYVLNQVVEALRTGSFGYSFQTVITVGHSFGSAIAVAHASQYDNVDAVLLTGYAHNADPINALAALYLYPANLDPKFGPLAPLNYLTTIPGSRGGLFYHTPTADPQVIALDEQLKDMVSDGLMADIPRFISYESLHIDAPVIMLLGDQDAIFCGGVVNCADPAGWHAYESDFFLPEACLETVIYPDTGHNLSLHTGAPTVHAEMVDWADRVLAAAPGDCPQRF